MDYILQSFLAVLDFHRRNRVRKTLPPFHFKRTPTKLLFTVVVVLVVVAVAFSTTHTL